MAGGNRAFTLQDVLGQLNQDSSGSDSNDSALQINQLTTASEGVAVSESVTLSTGPTSAAWAPIISSSPSVLSSPSVISGATTGGFKWGTTLWGLDGLDGGSASSSYLPGIPYTIDGGNASSVYGSDQSFDGGSALC